MKLFFYKYEDFQSVIYDQFASKTICKHPDLHRSVKEYLYNYQKNMNDLILNYREFMIMVTGYMFDIRFKYNVVNAFFDSVVDYIISKDLYHQMNNPKDFYILFVYLSPDKIYDLVHYIYQKCDKEHKEFIHQKLLSIIYLYLLFHEKIKKQYYYLDDHRDIFEEFIHPNYIIIDKLMKENIIQNIVLRDRSVLMPMFLEENVWENPEVEAPESFISLLSQDTFYKKILYNLMIDFSVHQNPILNKKLKYPKYDNDNYDDE